MRCLVAYCNNKSTGDYNDDQNISFYQLPKSPRFRGFWFSAIGEIILPENAESARICSEHFAPNSYIDPKYFEIENRKCAIGVEYLASNAIPSLNLRPRTQTIIKTIPTRKKKGSRFTHKKRERDYIVIKESHSNSKDEIPQTDITNADRFSTPNTDSIASCSSSPSSSTHNDSIITANRSERSYKMRNKSNAQTGIKRKYKSMIKNEQKRSRSAGESPVRKVARKNPGDESAGERDGTNDIGMPKDDELIEEKKDPLKIISRLKCNVYYHKSMRRSELNTKIGIEKERDEAKARCVKLALELRDEEKKREKITFEIEKLKLLNEELKAKLASRRTADKMEEGGEENLQEVIEKLLRSYFTDGQMRCMINGRKFAKWRTDDCAMAICLRSVSRKAYNYMRTKLNYPLPSLSSLRKWAITIFDISEGFLKDVLILMKEKSKSLKPMDKICTLTFGEMNLTKEICFDVKLQKVIGPCNRVLVIMVRGLFSNWKQPIYYEFDKPMSKEILDKSLSILHEAGYEVVAMTNSTENEDVWKEIGINEQNHFFNHPTIENGIVYAFADVPDLLKQLRNHFFDYGFVLPGCERKFTASMLENIVNDGRIGGSKLTKRVLEARNNFPKAVWPAVRIWSRSVARAVESAGKERFLNRKDYQKLSDFITAVNDWFDLHNSEKKKGGHRGTDAYGIDVRSQDATLLLMDVLIQGMKVGDQKTLTPFQKGIITSNASLRDLHSCMKRKFPQDYKYLITQRLQQDVIENFFSQIRDMGISEQLSGYDFRNRLHSYLVGENSNPVFNNNDGNIKEEFSDIRYSNCNSGHEERRNNFTDNFPRVEAENPNNLIDELNDISTIPNSDEPAYEYQPDSGDLVTLTGELFSDIIHSSSYIEDDSDDEDAEHMNGDMIEHLERKFSQDFHTKIVKNDSPEIIFI